MNVNGDKACTQTPMSYDGLVTEFESIGRSDSGIILDQSTCGSRVSDVFRTRSG